MNTTRTENGEGPYRRKVVVFQADNGTGRFSDVLARTLLMESMVYCIWRAFLVASVDCSVMLTPLSSILVASGR